MRYCELHVQSAGSSGFTEIITEMSSALIPTNILIIFWRDTISPVQNETGKDEFFSLRVISNY